MPFDARRGDTLITFISLPDQCVIRVFTADGRLAAVLHENDGNGRYDWDVKNFAGEGLAPGVYLYTVKAGSSKSSGKLVVIR